jgi:hypothetical protein
MNDQRTERTARADDGHRGVREVERDIERTRGAIDRTLDEIGDRLHPQQLLHQVIDVFKSDDDQPSEWAIEARRTGKKLARKIKHNPIPALMIGAGAAWLWMQDENEYRRRQMHRQWDDLPEHSGSYVDARTGKPYDEGYGAEYRRKKVSPAWHSDYDWSDGHDDEKSWTTRAESVLTELRTAISDTTRPLKERLGLVTGKVASLSGLKRSEIQQALREQWDGTPEHSGSFVDARTGEPYDDSYGDSSGDHWQQLAALDTLGSSDASHDEEDESWREKAEHTLASIQKSLSDTTGTAKDRLNAIGTQLGTLAQGSRSYATKYGQASRQRMRSLARGTRQGAQRLSHQVGSGYETTRDYVSETMEENPIAMGIAVLGLGLLVGAALPSTRAEDRAIGENADAVKARGLAAGREVLERGQEIATSAGEAAFDEAQRQGLTPSQIAERAKEGVDQVAGAVKQERSLVGDIRSKVESVATRAVEAAKEEMRDQQEGGDKKSHGTQGTLASTSTGASGMPTGASGVSTGASGMPTGASGMQNKPATSTGVPQSPPAACPPQTQPSTANKPMPPNR